MRGNGSALGSPSISSMDKKRLRLPRIIAGPFLGMIALLVGQVAWGADQISNLKPRIESPFRAEALNFYFVHSGGPLVLHF